MKKPARQQQRQRQKLSRKAILLICGASASCLLIGLTIFLHMSGTDHANASGSNLRFTSDQVFTVEKSISAPEIRQQTAPDSKTVFAKHIKPLNTITASR